MAGDQDQVGYVPDDEVQPSNETKDRPEETSSSRRRGPVKDLQGRLRRLQDSLSATEQERDEIKDRLLRNLAEMDNFRKRVKKEKEEYQKYVLSDFLLDLLVVVDNLERAVNSSKMSAEPGIHSGVELIYKQFNELLKKYQVYEIDALGKRFDPNLHQALLKEERAGIADPVVVEVLQRGFLYNDRLLRPVMVKVALPLEVEDTQLERN